MYLSLMTYDDWKCAAPECETEDEPTELEQVHKELKEARDVIRAQRVALADLRARVVYEEDVKLEGL